MKTITKTCLNCNKEFEASLSEHNRGNAKFCCHSCSTFYMHKTKESPVPNVECALCKKHFYKTPTKQKGSKSGLFFCSRNCKDKAQRIGGIKEIQPSHYGLGNGQHSYRKYAFDHFMPICSRCEYDKNIAALVVHHKDKDRTNNTIENLEILCANCHAIEHWETK